MKSMYVEALPYDTQRGKQPNHGRDGQAGGLAERDPQKGSIGTGNQYINCRMIQYFENIGNLWQFKKAVVQRTH